MDNDTTITAAPTSAWIAFGYLSFVVSLLMVGGGIYVLPLDYWVKGYFAMGTVLLIQACFALAKNLRDVHEAGRFHNRVENARTERLLADRS